MVRPNAPDRFNEEKSVYVVRGDGEGADKPDLERGAEVIRGVVIPYTRVGVTGGCMLALDYDLGTRGQGRPRVVRSLRLFVVGRHECSAHPGPAVPPQPAPPGPRSRPPF